MAMPSSSMLAQPPRHPRQPSCPSTSSSAATQTTLSHRCRSATICRASVADPRPKGWDRPWAVEANGAPAAAPPQRSAGDPFGVLLSQRTIFLGGEVEDMSADALVSQLLLLDNQEQGKDIKLFINSPGGSVTAGLGVYDAMMMCRSDVATYTFGLAASMGAFLLGAGKRGKRHAMPNARIMIHQPLGGAQGQAVDIEISAKEIMFHKANLNRIIADYTGQPLSRIEADTDRDNYMSPIQAREYGIIDHVIGGDEAVFQVKGSLRKFPKVKEEFIRNTDDLVLRNIMDGDAFSGPVRSHRFRSNQSEPYMPAQAPGTPWFRVKKISKEQYKEALERNTPDAGSDGSDSKRSPKDRIDSAW